MPLGQQPSKPRNVGLAFSGGGSRAIAFHLGCLRALHDLDLLSRVEVISSVSGGSVISAMYAYSCDPFQKFDERVVELLRRGLQRGILREMVRPVSIWRFLQNLFHRLLILCLPHATTPRTSYRTAGCYSQFQTTSSAHF